MYENFVWGPRAGIIFISGILGKSAPRFGIVEVSLPLCTPRPVRRKLLRIPIYYHLLLRTLRHEAFLESSVCQDVTATLLALPLLLLLVLLGVLQLIQLLFCAFSTTCTRTKRSIQRQQQLLLLPS